MTILRYAKVFEVFGHDTRLKVFDLIYRSGKKGVRPKEMIDQFGVDSGTLDFHLKKLLAVNLVARRQMGPGCLYHLNENIPVGLAQLFDANQQERELELDEEVA